ncbi:MAG: hypothetical protein NVS1B7_4860 [Candidatus Saccharimonadales bacterium]
MPKIQNKKKTAARTVSKKTPIAAKTRNQISTRYVGISVLLLSTLLVSLIASLYHPTKYGKSLLSQVSTTVTGKNPARIDTVKTSLTTLGTATSQSILVHFKNGTSRQNEDAINSKNGARVKHSIAGIDVQQVELAPGASVGETVKRYSQETEVLYAEPNYEARRFFTPNDSYYSQQWNLTAINAPPAWDVSRSSAGTIAIIDSGINANHSDLAGEVTPGYNFIANTTNTSDDNGHGTHVAGIVAAISNNNSGIASIGFTGKLMPVKVLGADGSGTYADLSSGIIYAANNGATIINLSLGGSSDSITLHDAISYAQQKGVIIIAAAGNNGSSVAVYPAAYSGVVSVSATDKNDNLASFSSYGSSIAVSAPGVGIVSTYNNGGYATMSGTSMAAPEVAGLIGLALAKNPSVNSQIIGLMEETADKVGPFSYDGQGHNQYFGYGRINAGKLLARINTPVAPPTAVSPPPNTIAPPTLTAPVSTTPAVPKPANNETNEQHGQQSISFSVELHGVIDSVDISSKTVMVKVSSISQNLPLPDDSLVKLYFDDKSTVLIDDKPSSLANLSAGQTVRVKAQWYNSQLAVRTINATSLPSSKARNSADNNQN